MAKTRDEESLNTKFYVLGLVIPLALFAFKVGESIYSPDSRAPASVAVDLSHLEGESFKMAAKVKMLEGMEVVAQDGRHLVTMGHFNGADDSRSSACQTYARVEYEFVAGDSVVSGEPTVMRVSGLCTVGADAAQLRALEIPYTRILSEKPGDRVLSIGDRDKVEITFENMGDEWPKEWNLKSASYVGSVTLKVNDRDIYNFRGRPFSLRWP